MRPMAYQDVPRGARATTTGAENELPSPDRATRTAERRGISVSLGEIESQEADEPPVAPRSVRDARIARSLVAAPGRLRRARQDTVRPGAAVVRRHRHTDRDRSSLGGPSYLVCRHSGPAMRDDVRFDLASVLVAGVGERIVAHLLEHGAGPSRGRARELQARRRPSVQRSSGCASTATLRSGCLRRGPHARTLRTTSARRIRPTA